MTNRKQLSLPNKYGIVPVFADACGNTFIILDCLKCAFHPQEWETLKQEIGELLRHANVDDVLVLRKIKESDQMIKVKMHVLEPDGSEADFCGNGARAVGQFLHRKYGADKKFSLVSRRGGHQFVFYQDSCLVELGRPLLERKEFLFDGHKLQLVDCVEPHLVTSDFFDAQMLTTFGHAINRDWKDRFPHGVNVNCFRKLGENTLEVLTYERGVYRITAACGTGSTACTQVAIKQKTIPSQADVRIKVLGGELMIQQIKSSFWLGGPVVLKY